MKCNANGQWEPQPDRCIPGPLTINIYLNEKKLTLQSFLNRNNATLIEILDDKVIIHTNNQDTNINIKLPETNSNLATEEIWTWS